MAPFKKGPDYIDAAWLGRAANRPCRNLDLFLLTPSTLFRSFLDASRDADIAVIEGNRGLHDGMDAEGSSSSGELAKLLKAPVLLSVDVTKTTRTAAALVLGCQTLDPDVPIQGVVLNRVAGSRHETVLRQSIEGICGIPVLGAIPRLPEEIFPERHLGLVPPQETDEVEDPLLRVRRAAENYLNVDAIREMASGAPPASYNNNRDPIEVRTEPGSPDDASPLARIGIFRDEAFQFYYPENLEALTRAGGELVEISPIRESALPEVDALYLGGGFPETLAPGLSENRSFMDSVRDSLAAGMPAYAECGGAVYLGRTLEYEGTTFEMVGTLPVDFGFQKKPRGHGYTVLETVGENPFYPRGQNIKGHEFHYTFMVSPGAEDLSFAFRVHRGYGFDGERDGLSTGNVLASYTHVHALGTTNWATALVDAGAGYRKLSG